MKLLTALTVTSVKAEWEQPTYFNALTAARQKSGGWGSPIGLRAAADWTLCPSLATPIGASRVVCDQSTCMVECQPGFQVTIALKKNLS